MTGDRLTVVAALPEHGRRVAGDLRAADRLEFEAAGFEDPEPVILAGILCGRAWAVLGPSGDAIAVGGIYAGETLGDARVWLLATPEIEAHSREFLRRGRSYLDALHEIIPVLHNTVHTTSRVHIRWLKWMGFTFIREVPNSLPEKGTSYEFIRTPPT